MAPVAPVPAATMIVARPCARPSTGVGFELLLMKRHRLSGFMAGAHVFPGGKLDGGDHALGESFAARWPSCAACVRALHHAQAPAFLGAALRETEEEAGIRLGQGGCPAVLSPWARWITPEQEPRRYDTVFFLAEVPHDTEVRPDGHEMVDHVWWTPAAALAAYTAQEVVLAPPTLCTLEDLASFTLLTEARAAVRLPLRAIMPVFAEEDGQLVLALPGDRLHPEPEAVSSQRTRLMREGHRFVSTRAPRA